MLYVVGRKALGYFTFRNWTITESWIGFSDKPTYEQSQEIADTLVAAFLAGADDEGEGPGDDGIFGVDELHIVFTEFKSMLTQSAEARRIAPMVVEYVEEDRPARIPCSPSSPMPPRCSSRCCRVTWPPGSSPRCWRPPLRSRRRGGAR